jgi:hypothetical protein
LFASPGIAPATDWPERKNIPCKFLIHPLRFMIRLAASEVGIWEAGLDKGLFPISQSMTQSMKSPKHKNSFLEEKKAFRQI